MNRYTLTFYLKDFGWPIVVTTKAESAEEATETLKKYCDGVFFGRVANYSLRIRSTEPA